MPAGWVELRRPFLNPKGPRMTASRLLHLTLCNAVKTTKVQHVAETWEALCARLTQKPVVTQYREALSWSLFVPFKMKDAGAVMRATPRGALVYSRCTANVEFADLICLDIDNDPARGAATTIEAARQHLDGLAYALYTSFNHRNPSKHDVDKFRVVLPLAESVTYPEFTERKRALKQLLPFIDPASLSISQPFYIPIAHPDRANLHQSFIAEGEWFDLRALEVTKPRQSNSPTAKFAQTGELHGDLPEIRLKDGATYRADQLYAVMKEGYEHRVGCFRISAADTKPGCFIFRKGSGLMYYDPAVGKVKFIKVMKVKRTESAHFDDEEDVETTQLWPRKPGSSLVPKVPEPPALIVPTEQPIELNQRYLPDDLHRAIPAKGIAVIRSPKGTGKTELLKRLAASSAQRGESVMLLGHRIFLLRNLATRTNLDYYLDLDDGDITSSMAICMNSLTRVDPHEDEPYDTIIIDESEQVFQALISKTLHADLSVIFNNLLWLFGNAKRIVCLDADLTSELTIELIQYLRGEKADDEVIGVKNTYQIGADQTTRLYETKMHLLSDALAAVESGEKVFIACNSRKFATVVDAILRSMGNASLLVTAETNDRPETRLFIVNPTEECKKYDAVVASPTLSTGVSIEGNHFTKVYGFFQIKPGTYQDVDQAISRVRNCTDVSVWVQGNEREPYIRSEQDLFYDALDDESKTVKLALDEKFTLTQGQRLWGYIYARIAYVLQLWSINKDDQFSQLRKDLGFKIGFVLEDEQKSKAGREIYGQFRHAGINRAQAIFEAADIDPEEEERLARKRQRDGAEQLALEKARLRSYLKDDWSLETVKKALKQELLRSINRIATLHSVPEAVLRQQDIDDRVRNENTFTANRHRLVRRKLIDHLCKAGNIDRHELFRRVQASEEVEITRDALLAVAKAFEERKRDFRRYFETRIKDPTDEKNITKVWNATFGDFLSMPIKRKKRGPRSQREYRYYIDLEANDLVHGVLGDYAFFQ